MSLSRSLLWRIVFILSLCAISVLATQAVNMPSPVNNTDKYVHGLAFFTLSIIASFTLLHPLIWITILVTFGGAIEFAQHYLPYRSASWFDWGADLIGIAAYLVLFQLPPLKSLSRWFTGGHS